MKIYGTEIDPNSMYTIRLTHAELLRLLPKINEACGKNKYAQIEDVKTLTSKKTYVLLLKQSTNLVNITWYGKSYINYILPYLENPVEILSPSLQPITTVGQLFKIFLKEYRAFSAFEKERKKYDLEEDFSPRSFNEYVEYYSDEAGYLITNAFDFSATKKGNAYWYSLYTKWVALYDQYKHLLQD